MLLLQSPGYGGFQYFNEFKPKMKRIVTIGLSTTILIIIKIRWFYMPDKSALYSRSLA